MQYAIMVVFVHFEVLTGKLKIIIACIEFFVYGASSFTTCTRVEKNNIVVDAVRMLNYRVSADIAFFFVSSCLLLVIITYYCRIFSLCTVAF